MGKPSRKRKKDTREVKNRFFILCEGEKTEPNYFDGYIRDKGYDREKQVAVKVIETRINTACELVTNAARYKRELAEDHVWVVFDKDEYRKHEEAFARAEKEGVKIAFSSICFEFWLLLHYERTTAAFSNCETLIKERLSKHLDYTKARIDIYEKVKNNIQKAIENANWSH